MRSLHGNSSVGRVKGTQSSSVGKRFISCEKPSVGASGAAGTGASISLNVMKQCSIAERTEVQLRTNRGSQYPFRVATFNVLADGLAQSGDFVKVPISCLSWEYRLPLILQEIRAANADIICLQELNHFDTLATTLVPEGYSCFFRAKKPSPALKFGFPADGIALFYRHSRFSCSPAPAGHCFDSIDGQPAAQGFVTAQLLDKLCGRAVIVAATHLKAKAGFENEQTRVHQACQLLKELQNMRDRFSQSQLQQLPPNASSNGTCHTNNIASGKQQQPAVLICGDFNTTPDSETVEVMKQHELALESIWDVPWEASKHIQNGNGTCCHNGDGGSHGGMGITSLASSSSNGTNGKTVQQQCYNVDEGQQASEFTTWKFRSNGVAKRTIDYIWFSKQQLVPISRWRMLSEEEIGPQGLPNMTYPSDHMCVTCEFGWAQC